MSSVARTALSILVVATIAAGYFFFLTAGLGALRPRGQHYYELLADGFLQGHLYLPVPPSRTLLQQADPYDPRTSSHYWLWDASLYDGKYFFYFGPAPALLIAGIKLVRGPDVVVEDQQLILAFVVGRLVAGAALLALVRRRLFPTVNPWTLVPALLLFGLSNPFPYQLGRPGVYEAAIDSAQFFLMLGLLAGFVALGSDRSSRRRSVLLVAAGCCWAAVLACRVSLLFAVMPLVVLTALAASRGAPRPARDFLLRAGLVGSPVATVLIALGFYNFARFGSFVEFGTSFQLTGRRYHPTLSLVLPNLHAYLMRRFTLSCEFPFVGAPYYANNLTPHWVTPDSGYLAREPVVGVLYAAPFVVFGVAAIATAASLLRRRPAGGLEETDGLTLWLVGCCTAISLLAGLPALGVWESTMRYLSDVTPAALVLAIVGFWTLLARPQAALPRRRLPGLRTAGALLAFYTVSVGVLFGFRGGYANAIWRYNRPLFTMLVEELSLCRPSPEAPPAPPRLPNVGTPR